MGGNLCVLSSDAAHIGLILVPGDRGVLPEANGLLLWAVDVSFSILQKVFWAWENGWQLRNV